MMAITLDYVKELFSNLETGNTDKFFNKVADDVEWKVLGTFPLAGTHTSKNVFIEKTFARLNRIMRDGALMKVNHIIVSGDEAVVEMESLSRLKDGKPFRGTYCWVMRFDGDVIVKVHAYVDSALVKNVLEEYE